MSQSLLERAPHLARLTDEDVVKRVLDGEVELFEILMRRYNRRLFRIARGFVGSQADAVDVVQEAYVRAYENLAGFRGDAKFATWLTRIAVHEAIGLSRRRGAETPVEGFGCIESALAAPDHEAMNEELGRLLENAVDTLPAPMRSVLLMREVERIPIDEIASALGISVANVRVRLHRSKASLRAVIDRRMGVEIRKLYQFAGSHCDALVDAVFARLGRIRPDVERDSASEF